jgi:hypothetical protein
MPFGRVLFSGGDGQSWLDRQPTAYTRRDRSSPAINRSRRRVVARDHWRRLKRLLLVRSAQIEKQIIQNSGK